MKNIFLSFFWIISVFCFTNAVFAEWDQPSSTYPWRFIIKQNCTHYEWWCTTNITDTTKNIVYGKNNDLWWTVQVIRVWVSWVFILLENQSGNSIYLCSPRTGKCSFIISTEQLLGKYTKTNQWIITFDTIYDFELLTKKRIKIFLSSKNWGWGIISKIIKF